MRVRWVLGPLALVLLRADMYQDASNATDTALQNLGPGRTYVYGVNHGMKCNGGASDNTAELQAAVDATVALNVAEWGNGHGVLVLPAGYCFTSAPITIGSEITITGAGGSSRGAAGNPQGTTIRSTSATADVFTIVSDDAVHFANFTIDSAGTVVKTAGAAINITGNTSYNYGSTFQGMQFNNVWDGIRTQRAFGYTISGNSFVNYHRDAIFQEGHVLSPDGALKYSTITNNLMWSPAADARACFEVWGAGGGWFTGNTCEGGDYGVLVDQHFGTTGNFIIEGNSIATNKISNIAFLQTTPNMNYGQTWITKNKIAQIAGNPLTSNSIYVGPGDGLSTSKWLTNLHIKDNTFYFNVASVGSVPALINLTDGQHTEIDGNIFDTLALGPYHGIAVSGLAQDVAVGANMMPSPVAGYGLYASGINWGVITTALAAQPNLLLNPAHAVDQVNEGATQAFTGSGSAYCMDGWSNQIAATNGQTATCQRTADAPAGSAYSLLVTVTASGATAATDYARVTQRLPADVVANLGYGAATARETILRYNIKSSIVGTSSVHLANAANNRALVGSCTIAAANTWTSCHIAIPGDITGTWVGTGQALAAALDFVLTAGSSRNTATPNVWAASTLLATSGQTNLTETNGATFQIAAVKWELGKTPSRFVQRPLNEELVLTQRYYRKTFPVGTKPATNAGLPGARCEAAGNATAGALSLYLPFDPPMNASPTITTYNPSAANANWRNVTGAADAVVQVDPGAAKSAAGVQISEQTTALVVGNNYCIHAVADARL